MRESNGVKYYDCIIESCSVGPGYDKTTTQLSLKLRECSTQELRYINLTLDPKYNTRNVETLREVGIDCPNELTPTAALALEVHKVGVCYVEKMSDDGKERRYLNAPGKAFVYDNRDESKANRPTKPMKRTRTNTESPF